MGPSIIIVSHCVIFHVWRLSTRTDSPPMPSTLILTTRHHTRPATRFYVWSLTNVTIITYSESQIICNVTVLYLHPPEITCQPTSLSSRGTYSIYLPLHTSPTPTPLSVRSYILPLNHTVHTKTTSHGIAYLTLSRTMTARL